ncbi:hypothetical protein [Pseudomonas sp. PDM13]|uniref:hypothetical protein n=1 Tax=Pseudomonas sp. PDM13 TaxID=2769255 RepID=UPI0021E00785|nr:hypothetical protein [Pseudomonas sp. PDM13]MCU9949407.1 hypothetical protein [Pseudomonas sp. PDM13]
MQKGKLMALSLMAPLLGGCDALMQVEGTIEPQLFQRSTCELSIQTAGGWGESMPIAHASFTGGMLTGPAATLYTVRVDCRDAEGTLLASRKEVVTLGGSSPLTLYMGLISDTTDKPPRP